MFQVYQRLIVNVVYISQSSLYMWFGFYPRIRIMNHWKTSLMWTCIHALFDYFFISSTKDKNTFDFLGSKLFFTCTFAQCMWNWFDLEKNLKEPLPPPPKISLWVFSFWKKHFCWCFIIIICWLLNVLLIIWNIYMHICINCFMSHLT